MNSLHRIALAVSLALPVCVMAQSANEQAPRPPQLEILEEGAPPTISNSPTDEAKTGNYIEEKRRADGTTEVKVKSGPSTYHVKQGRDGTGEPVSRAQWKIKEFEAGGRKANTEHTAEKPAP